VSRRRRIRRKQLLDDLEGKREYSKLKEEALDGTLRRAGFRIDKGLVVQQTTELMKTIWRVKKPYNNRNNNNPNVESSM
jgi:hypothetical protein